MTNTSTLTVQNLQNSLQDALRSLPPESTLQEVQHGLSLLDAKTDLALSYVHHLVFLLYLKIHEARALAERKRDQDSEGEFDLHNDVVKTLVRDRTYLEKGVKSLEGRMKPQLDRLVRMVEEEALQPCNDAAPGTTRNLNLHHRTANPSDDSHADSDLSEPTPPSQPFNEMTSYGPNTRAISTNPSAHEHPSRHPEDGLYRPPRINPTSMPTTTTTPAQRDARGAKRTPRSAALMDEYIATELSTAPVAEPSIGSGIREGGRVTLSARERAEAAEVRAYEEANFVRLPVEGKRRRVEKRRGYEGFGGEEWSGLGAGLERIERVTGKPKGKGKGKGKKRKGGRR